jgi:hypothetical protein
MIRLFAAAALTFLAVYSYRNVRRGARPGGSGDTAAAPRPLQTWEGEGGGVPASNAQTLVQEPPADASGASLGKNTTH